MRTWIALVVAGLLLLPLPATAQAPPAPRPAQTCEEARAGVVLRQSVEIDGVPAGVAVAWSCGSVEEAQAALAERVAEVQLRAWCWYGRGEPPPTGVACPDKP